MEEKQFDTNKQTGIAVVKSVLNNKAKDTKEFIKSEIIKGDANAAYIAVILKKFEKIFKETHEDKELWNIIEEQVKAYRSGDKKTFELFGAKVTIADGGYWDYSQTEDPVLSSLKEIQEAVKVQIKVREEELQAKAKAWESRNTPSGDQPFKMTPFVVTWDELPTLTWEEAAGETQTNPPVKRGKEQLRFSL